MSIPYKQFLGSPDIFKASGERINEAEATAAGLFLPGGQLSADVERIATPRPDVKTEADFAQLNQKNLPFVSSSDAAVQNENNITQTVGGLSAPNISITNAQNASQAVYDLIDKQNAELEKRRAEQTAQIEASFAESKRQTGISQQKETGATNVALQRTGGYLGTQISGVGVLNNLAQTHQIEMGALEAKRVAAIQEANSAINDQQFKLAAAKADEVKRLEKEINDRSNTFFDQTMKITQENRAQEEFQKTQMKSDLELLSYLDPAEVSPYKKSQIDNTLGVAGFTDRYLKIVNDKKILESEKAKAESEKAQIDITKSRLDILTTQKNLDQKDITMKKDMIGLLQDIPNGQTIKFPDGTEYTGMGKAGDISTFMETNDSGVATLITYDKATGKTSAQSLGVVGKTKTASGSERVDPATEDGVKGLLQIRLEESKNTDGQYDPDVYMQERKMIKQAYPQLVESMDKLFLNKDNQFFSDEAITRLRSKGIFFNDVSLAPTINVNTSLLGK